MAKKKTNGITGLQDLLDRCRVDELTGCQVYPARTAWVPAGMLGNAVAKSMAAQRVAWLLAGGKLRADQDVARLRATCCGRCITPAHHVALTRAEVGALSRRDGRLRGHVPTMVRNARIAAMNATPRDVVARVEAMLAAGATGMDASRASGLSKTLVSRIKAGRHPHCSARSVPVVPVASVFALGAACGASARAWRTGVPGVVVAGVSAP